jgi:hypothetical protein
MEQEKETVVASHGGGGQTGEVAERYRASMVLAGVGDAMGYRNGVWEFTFDGTPPPPTSCVPRVFVF